VNAPAQPGWAALLRFVAALLLLLAILAGANRPVHTGDVEEYAIMTIALANHASAEVRAEDLAQARIVLPDFRGGWDALEPSVNDKKLTPKPGFYRDLQGDVRAIHFSTYPALAVLPMRALELIGRNPLRCFQVVNYAMIFVLGLALFRLFGDGRRALLGVVLFLLCGGYLYSGWSSPECVSAAALLAALVFACSGAPVLAGLLAGIAASQNPSVVLFCVFAPLLQVATGTPWRSVFKARNVIGLGLAGLLFALSPVYNYVHFGVPSIIAKISTTAELANWHRLFSLFFDLNQGMLYGAPALMAVVLSWCLLRAPRPTVAAMLFAVALAAPTLVTQNWNSAAAGMMRYAFWCSMPLLFAFLWQLGKLPRWPAALIIAVLLVQAGTPHMAESYHYLEFNPVASTVMAKAPDWYNPDPEIFWERVAHAESFPEPERIWEFAQQGVVSKRLMHISNVNAGSKLCGAGKTFAADSNMRDVGWGWRYLNGPLKCVPA
jgi:hypothetical protein